MRSPTYHLLPFGVMIVAVGFLLSGTPGDVLEMVGVLLLVASMYFDIRQWRSRRSNKEEGSR